jgi:hypothetical protein
MWGWIQLQSNPGPFILGMLVLQTTILSRKQSKLAPKEFVIMVLFQSGFVFSSVLWQ